MRPPRGCSSGGVSWLREVRREARRVGAVASKSRRWRDFRGRGGAGTCRGWSSRIDKSSQRMDVSVDGEFAATIGGSRPAAAAGPRHASGVFHSQSDGGGAICQRSEVGRVPRAPVAAGLESIGSLAVPHIGKGIEQRLARWKGIWWAGPCSRCRFRLVR